MSRRLAILLGSMLLGCARARSEADPHTALPASTEVLLDGRGGHELVGGIDGDWLKVIARPVGPAENARTAPPWITSLDYELWCDQDGDGQRSQKEGLASGSWSGEATRFRILKSRLPRPLPPGPLYLSVSYRDATKLHTPPSKKLR